MFCPYCGNTVKTISERIKEPHQRTLKICSRCGWVIKEKFRVENETQKKKSNMPEV